MVGAKERGGDRDHYRSIKDGLDDVVVIWTVACNGSGRRQSLMN